MHSPSLFPPSSTSRLTISACAFANSSSNYAHPVMPPATAPIFTDDPSEVEQVVRGLIMDFMFVQAEPPER